MTRRDGAERDPAGLWAISAYFNPVGYQRRLRNYHVFRRHLTVPLVTVELSFDGSFHLAEGDADTLVQLHGGDIMWQKERLLNIALQHVPPNCDKIAWLDCDVILYPRRWPELAVRMLDRYPVTHLFQEMHEPRSSDVPRNPAAAGGQKARSIIREMELGRLRAEVMSSNVRVHGVHAGLAWAARREVLQPLGFYDACILGSGNRAILCAGLGRFEDARRYLRMGDGWFKHYLEWARRHHEAVRGQVGYLPGRVQHLWHGELEDRRYAERHVALQQFGFDPYRDIVTDDRGCWRWASDKPDMQRFVWEYFTRRMEDGRRAWQRTVAD